MPTPADEIQIASDEKRAITLELTDLVAGGDALGRADGRATFVRGGLPGELVRARIVEERKSFARAEVVEILRTSPERIALAYPELAETGGFQWQHLAYRAQLTWKTRIVRQQLIRIGGFSDPVVRPTIGMPEGSDTWSYRSVAQFAVGADGAIGFRRAGSHDVIEMTDCPLAHPALAALYRDVRNWLRATWGDEPARLVGRFSLRIGLGGDPETGRAPGEAAGVLTLEAGPDTPRDPAERLAICQQALAAAPGLVGALLRDHDGAEGTDRAGSPYVYERVRGCVYRISPDSFFQVNYAQTPTLVRLALEAARPRSSDRALDGYSGVGLFSLALAERVAQVWAIESQPSAVEDARINAAANGVENVTAIEGFFERALSELAQRSERVDVALVDPPRAGCDARALRTLRELAPRTLVYVSCDPSTLARDLRLFCADGYRLAWAQPVDLFPFTAHIECVALVERTSDARRGRRAIDHSASSRSSAAQKRSTSSSVL